MWSLLQIFLWRHKVHISNVFSTWACVCAHVSPQQADRRTSRRFFVEHSSPGSCYTALSVHRNIKHLFNTGNTDIQKSHIKTHVTFIRVLQLNWPLRIVFHVGMSRAAVTGHIGTSVTNRLNWEHFAVRFLVEVLFFYYLKVCRSMFSNTVTFVPIST